MERNIIKKQEQLKVSKENFDKYKEIIPEEMSTAIKINEQKNEEKAKELLESQRWSKCVETILVYTIEKSENAKEILEKNIHILPSNRSYLELVANGEEPSKIANFCANTLIKELKTDYKGAVIRAIGYGRDYSLEDCKKIIEVMGSLLSAKKIELLDEKTKETIQWIVMILESKAENSDITKLADKIIDDTTKANVEQNIKKIIELLDNCKKEEIDKEKLNEFFLSNKKQIDLIKKIKQIPKDDKILVDLFLYPNARNWTRSYIAASAAKSIKNEILKKIEEQNLKVPSYIMHHLGVKSSSKKQVNSESLLSAQKTPEFSNLNEILKKVLLNFVELKEKEKSYIIQSISADDEFYKKLFFREDFGLNSKLLLVSKIKDKQIKKEILEECKKDATILKNSKAKEKIIKILEKEGKPVKKTRFFDSIPKNIIQKILKYGGLGEKEKQSLVNLIEEQPTQTVEKLSESAQLNPQTVAVSQEQDLIAEKEKLKQILKNLYSVIAEKERTAFLLDLLKKDKEGFRLLSKLDIISQEDINKVEEYVENQIKELKEFLKVIKK